MNISCLENPDNNQIQFISTINEEPAETEKSTDVDKESLSQSQIHKAKDTVLGNWAVYIDSSVTWNPSTMAS